MVVISFDPSFQKLFSRIRNVALKEKILKQIAKIKENPEIGKHMKYDRRGTRELYIKPFRLSYAYIKDKSTIILLDLYHKDEQ